jgi:hypothetical protein
VNASRNLGTGFFVQKEVISAFKWVAFVSNRMPYMILKGSWCALVFRNFNIPNDKSDDTMMVDIKKASAYCGLRDTT